MMVAVVILALLMVRQAPSSRRPDRQPTLSKAAGDLARPIFSEFFAGHAEEHDDQGRFRGPSPRMAVFERKVERLLATSGDAADEAIAALLAFYVGEHPGEELKCEAIRRGARMRRHLERFRDLTPVTGLEPIRPFFTTIPNARKEVLEAIDAGRTCEPL
jgi:hypothetical protein